MTPTVTPTPSATPSPTSTQPVVAISLEQMGETGVIVSETTVTLPTYPIWDYLTEQLDPVYNIPVYYFNRSEFEAAAPPAESVDYRGIVLENPYLRLIFLPELGGRLYSVVIKTTNQEIFYHNPVVKPSRYGVLRPGEANWWLATGGMEWAYPTQEHGYRWGIPWAYDVTQTPDGATITLSDTTPDRIGAEVSVTLPADKAQFTVIPQLVNPGANPVPVQFWLNAALTLASDTLPAEIQFVVPTDEVIVHSRGEADWSVPDAREVITWPWAENTDLSSYGQWANYLGVFIPYLEAPFMGAYNPTTDVGVARLIEPGMVPGSKLFAFSLSFPDRSYTDDNSQYFEIWGGANTGFWPEADVTVPGGGSLSWQESWWPLAGLGGLTWANQNMAIYLDQTDDKYQLSALTARPQQGNLTILVGSEPVRSETFSAEPTKPLQWQFMATDKPIRLEFTDNDNFTLLDYCVNC